jgi:CRP-like cAMP-binding protein
MSNSDHSSNSILASLPPADLSVLSPQLKEADLPLERVLFDEGGEIDAIYFPHGGVVSLVVGLASGQWVEAAMIGRDGVVGAAAAFGRKRAINRAIVQLAGTASVLPADVARAFADAHRPFRDLLGRNEELVLAQAQQSGACNAVHRVEQRLARWLLRCRDLVRRDELELTQEFLAEILAVRRSSVTEAAMALQDAGLITYRRGTINLLNIEGLEETSCECLQRIRSVSDMLEKVATNIPADRDSGSADHRGGRRALPIINTTTGWPRCSGASSTWLGAGLSESEALVVDHHAAGLPPPPADRTFIPSAGLSTWRGRSVPT